MSKAENQKHIRNKKDNISNTISPTKDFLFSSRPLMSKYICVVCPICEAELTFRSRSLKTEDDFKCPMCNIKLDITF